MAGSRDIWLPNTCDKRSKLIAGVRKKLRLRQKEAAELFGGGHNGFSRYENGRAVPLIALMPLFRLLDKHPELINDLGSGLIDRAKI